MSSSSSNNNGPPVTATEASSTPATETSSSYSSSEFQEVDTSKIQTVEEAMETLNRLRAMKDTLVKEKERNDSYMKRYTEKVAKCQRMAELHNLIPRQLFVREDKYNDELEKVYKWSGISDKEISEIYQRKLFDASKSNNSNTNSKFKHHGASRSTAMTRDPYAGFRDVPDFTTKVNGGKSPNSSINDVVTRNLDMMRRISKSSS
jgi:hypothetical protein